MDTRLLKVVVQEEVRGAAKWGNADTSPSAMLNAATEELGEVAHAINHSEGADRIAQEIAEVIGILSRMWSMVVGSTRHIVDDEPPTIKERIGEIRGMFRKDIGLSESSIDHILFELSNKGAVMKIGKGLEFSAVGKDPELAEMVGEYYKVCRLDVKPDK